MFLLQKYHTGAADRAASTEAGREREPEAEEAQAASHPQGEGLCARPAASHWRGGEWNKEEKVMKYPGFIEFRTNLLFD